MYPQTQDLVQQTQALVQQIMAKYPGITAQQALQMLQQVQGAAKPGMAQPPQTPFLDAATSGGLAPSGGTVPPPNSPADTGAAPPMSGGGDQSGGQGGNLPKSVTAGPNQSGGPPPAGPAAGPPDTGPAPGAASPAPQTGAGSQGMFNGPNGQARTEQTYGLQPGEQLRDWASRVFSQGMADSGQNLYSDTNPYANGPWASFLKSRYGTDMPMQALMGAMENPVEASNGTTGGVPNYISDAMRQMATGKGGSAGGIGGLQRVGQLMSANIAGEQMDPVQSSLLKEIAGDPSASTQMILSQLQGATGGFGMRNAAERLSALQQHYYNDPYNMDPANGVAKTPFYNQAIKMLGIGG